MGFVVLNYEEAHKFVEQTRGARWDGYDIVIWKEDPSGFMTKVRRMKSGNVTTGEFRRRMPEGRGWGIAERVPVSSNGTWKVKVNEPRRTTRA